MSKNLKDTDTKNKKISMGRTLLSILVVLLITIIIMPFYLINEFLDDILNEK